MKLTHKERAVLGLLAIGMKPAEIKKFLGISQYAFAYRREGMMAKLGATNDVQLGVLCERLQLLPAAVCNRAEDGRQERQDAQRTSGGQTLDQFVEPQGAR